MAGEAEHQDILTPEDDGSLASILAQEQERAMAVHAGGDVSPEVEEEETPPEASEPPVEAAPEKEAAPEVADSAPEKKYKSWEEAEAGAKEHQRFATEKAEEAKRHREALEAAERERDELRQKLAEKEKEPEPPVKTAEELEAEQEAKIEQALDEIGQLDESDPAYTKKVAKAWRKAGIGGAGQPAIPDDKALDALIDQRLEQRLEERLQARDAAKEAAQVKETQEQAAARLLQDAIGIAAKSGLDMTEDSADALLFDAMRRRLPEEYDTKPLEEQVGWVVNEVRKRTGQVVQSKEERDRLAREAQRANAVLGRGTTAPKKVPEPEGPATLNSVLNEVQQERIARQRRT